MACGNETFFWIRFIGQIVLFTVELKSSLFFYWSVMSICASCIITQHLTTAQSPCFLTHAQTRRQPCPSRALRPGRGRVEAPRCSGDFSRTVRRESLALRLRSPLYGKKSEFWGSFNLPSALLRNTMLN